MKKVTSAAVAVLILFSGSSAFADNPQTYASADESKIFLCVLPDNSADNSCTSGTSFLSKGNILLAWEPKGTYANGDSTETTEMAQAMG